MVFHWGLSDNKSPQVSGTLLSIIIISPPVFYCCLSDSKSPQVSRTLLNILADFNNAVVWIISILPLIYNTSRPFLKTFGTFPRAQTGIIVYIFTLWSAVMTKFARWQVLFFLFIIIIIIIIVYANFHTITFWWHSLMLEWHQISHDLQNFSQYSSQSRHCCGLDGFNASSGLQLTSSLCKVIYASS